MNKNRNRQMLEGPIGKSILSFFFPIMIGTFFQQLYNTVDAAIVGQFAGKEALSSVGGSSAIIINLMVGFFTGLSGGCTVLISQFFGAGDAKKLSKSLHTSYCFGAIGGLIFGLIGIIASPYILVLMNTPDRLMDSSKLYLQIYFAGLVFVFIYNMGASILRALGDSRRPLYYLIICTVINVILDLLFVIYFNLGVLGVALATLLAQAVSAYLVTRCLMKKIPDVKLELKELRIDKNLLGNMLKIGLPAGIQSSTYALSNMFIQSSINLFGVDAVAGWTAEGKVDVIFWMINGSFGTSIATFVGQNYGAGNMKRVKKGTFTCLMMSLGTAIVLSSVLFMFGQYPLRLFTDEMVVLDYAKHMMRLICPAYPLFVFIEIFSSTLRAKGDTLIPTAFNIVGIVAFRVVWISIFGKGNNLDVVLYCYPISWLICAIMISVYYFFRRNKNKIVV